MINPWLFTVLYASTIFGIQLLYNVAFFAAFSGAAGLGAIAATAGYLIGSSLGLGPANRYLKLPTRYLTYRKSLGIVGTLLALLFAVLQLRLQAQYYLHDFPFGLLTPPSLLGIFSLSVFAGMTLLSNRRAMSLLGGRRWKSAMRWGYAAYLGLVLRAVLIEGDDWLAWAADAAGLPPPRLLLSIFALLVVLSGLSQHLWPASARLRWSELRTRWTPLSSRMVTYKAKSKPG